MPETKYQRMQRKKKKAWVKHHHDPLNRKVIRAVHKALVDEFPEAGPVLTEMTDNICESPIAGHIFDTLKYCGSLIEVSGRMAEERLNKAHAEE